MNIPVMLRKARKAVAQESFVEAERLYALVLQDKDMQGMLDIKIRHAFCLEKIDNITEAVAVYQSVVQEYQTQGEVGAAKALELKITILGKLLVKDADVAAEAQSEMETVGQGLDAMLEGKDTTNFEGVDLLGLETCEMTPEQEIVADTEHHVVLDLVPIEEEKRAMEKMQVSTVELIIAHEKNIAAQKKSKEEPKDKASLVVIQDMIKKGIHKNVTHKSDKEDEDIVFTDIGDFKPQLPSDAARKQADNETSELNLQGKAGDLFGK